jgi:hypothetical protein
MCGGEPIVYTEDVRSSNLLSPTIKTTTYVLIANLPLGSQNLSWYGEAIQIGLGRCVNTRQALTAPTCLRGRDG